MSAETPTAASGGESRRAAIEPSIQLARQALLDTMAGRPADATARIWDVYRKYETFGLMCALGAWGDAYVDHATAGMPMDLAGSSTVLDPATGRLVAIESAHLEPPVRWAAEFIRAYSAGRDTRCGDLLKELMEGCDADGCNVAQYICAVLHITATSILSTPRGFAALALWTAEGKPS